MPFPSFPNLAAAAARLPSLCAVCRGWGAGRLCDPCVRRFAAAVPRCRRCALEVPPGPAVCGSCLVEPPPFAQAVTALAYTHPWDGLIAHFKFHGALDLAPAFARLIRDAATRENCSLPSLLLPMTLSDERLRERGYNQAWELARRVGRGLRCTADAELLRRVKDTPHQLTLPPEHRADNVRDAFAVAPRQRAALRGRRVALVDDVMTTGATAAEAARTLLDAGASEVGVWVVARTPRPGEA